MIVTLAGAVRTVSAVRDAVLVISSSSASKSSSPDAMSGAGAPSDGACTARMNVRAVNTARAAYGLPPLVLSSALSAVANEHSWDMLTNGYFSHTSIDGRTKENRLNNAGISYSWNGENICYSYNAARSPTDVLNWCHSQFMSEPYPGYSNHIGNILSTHYHKIGIGIAVSGAKVYITWDFTD